MTPDQYRREGAEAMRKAAADMIEDDCSFMSQHGMAQAIRAIDVDEVLSEFPTAPDAVAQLVEAAIAEYLLEPPFQTELKRMGRKATARGMMMRLGIYEKFKEALAAMEANHGD